MELSCSFPPGPRVVEYAQEAERLFREARSLYLELATDNPKLVNITASVGSALYKQRRFDEALPFFPTNQTSACLSSSNGG